MSLLAETEEILKQMFENLDAGEVDIGLFTEGQSPGDDLYQVSKESEKSYDWVTSVEVYPIRSITETDVRNFGQVIVDAECKFIFRSEVLKDKSLWDTTRDRATIDIKSVIQWGDELYRVLLVQEIGKLEKNYIAVKIFGRKEPGSAT